MCGLGEPPSGREPCFSSANCKDGCCKSETGSVAQSLNCWESWARGSNTMQHIVKRLGVSSRCWHLLVPMSCCRTVSRAQPDCIRCQHQCMWQGLSLAVSWLHTLKADQDIYQGQGPTISENQRPPMFSPIAKKNLTNWLGCFWDFIYIYIYIHTYIYIYIWLGFYINWLTIFGCSTKFSVVSAMCQCKYSQRSLNWRALRIAAHWGRQCSTCQILFPLQYPLVN